MTGLDIFFAALAVALVAHGVWKGGVRTLFGLAGLIAAYLFAGYAAAPIGTLLTALPGWARQGAALVLGFALIFTVVALVGILLNRAVDAAGLSPLNRTLGGLLGLALACYLAGGALHLAPHLGRDFGAMADRSWLTRTLSAGALFLDRVLPSPVEGVPPPPAAPSAPAPPTAPAPAPGEGTP
jgi:membrane protein required for colicin V production